MTFLAAHPYLILSLLLLAGGLVSFANLRSDVRRSVSVAALLALPYSLTAVGFEDYWHPARFGGSWIGIEDMLLCLSSGGFAWATAARGAAGLSVQLETAKVIGRYLGTTIWGTVVFSACRFSGMCPSAPSSA